MQAVALNLLFTGVIGLTRMVVLEKSVCNEAFDFAAKRKTHTHTQPTHLIHVVFLPILHIIPSSTLNPLQT